MARSENGYPFGKVGLFAGLAVLWVVLDQVTKSFFAGQEPGGIIAGPFFGLVDIRLVHNTGGAWGIFSQSTFGLGVFSLIVCAVIAAFFLGTARQCNLLQTVSFALIVAGGIGNAIDRFAQGFVIDFIEFSFIDFPVFNVADIGVTCGFALLVIGMLLNMKNGEPEIGER
ncbi:MAG: signal peptidase II [Eggerthellaceae bacterium]|nr:signal peptidase II [Eggerthellaceae bacterium]